MNNRFRMIFAAVSLMVTATAFAAGPQGAPSGKSKIPADLAAEARISLDTARSTALSHVSKGEIRSEELEREHGKLIYSFDVAVPGRAGIQEVNVSAISGKILGIHHETAKDERKEAAREHQPSDH